MPESDNYEVLEKIGHGSFGVIRKVRRKADGMIVCRKEISYLKMSQKEREQLHAEFQILSTLRHENIVGYFHREHLKSTQDLYLYMEYCGNGDLGRVIRDLKLRNQYAEESFVWSIFSQLVTALYRCHYGIDPPEVGKNVLGLGQAAKPQTPAGGMTILHRDLKPENVFLGEGNLVKLGDFGLAKMIQSHDFASTYVGTPFYMSPEICAAEKYTLKSDIWSLGCIVYELCTREPPFNAKTHFQLVQKIKEGKVTPLPSIYSPELMAVIKDCLRVNPDRRPDTATLLNLPVTRLMRKEKEVVDMSKLLKAKEDQLNARAQDFDRKVESMRREIDAALHREWEVKARLEIDRVVKEELGKLQRTFELEVQARVEAELLQQARSKQKAVAFRVLEDRDSGNEFSSSLSKTDYRPRSRSRARSSLGDGSAHGDVSSATDLTELSVHSPEPGDNNNSPFMNNTNSKSSEPAKRSTRTPFARAQTMFVATPMDVEMASPSPMAIASLSLSPRRNAATKPPPANAGNIFAIPSAIAEDPRWQALRDRDNSSSATTSTITTTATTTASSAAATREGGPGGSCSSPPDSDDEDESIIPSPTRMIKSRQTLIKLVSKAGLLGGLGGGAAVGGGSAQTRPGLFHQKSAPLNKLRTQQQQLQQPSLLPPGGGGAAAADGLRNANSAGALRERCTSPNRRLSKIPSAANLGLGMGNNTDGVPVLARKPSLSKKELAAAAAAAAATAASENSGSNGGNGSTGNSSGGSSAPTSTTSSGLVSKKGAISTTTTTSTATSTTSAGSNNIKGRTLVELQQARAGGRPLSAVLGGAGENGNLSPKKAFRDHLLSAAATATSSSSRQAVPPLEPAAVWDPERDEMPSPFLVRRKPIAR